MAWVEIRSLFFSPRSIRSSILAVGMDAMFCDSTKKAAAIPSKQSSMVARRIPLLVCMDTLRIIVDIDEYWWGVSGGEGRIEQGGAVWTPPCLSGGAWTA